MHQRGDGLSLKKCQIKKNMGFFFCTGKALPLCVCGCVCVGGRGVRGCVYVGGWVGDAYTTSMTHTQRTKANGHSPPVSNRFLIRNTFLLSSMDFPTHAQKVHRL